MRKLFLFTVAVISFCFTARSQSITPSVLNATGGTSKVNKDFNLDWSVAEMTLVNTMQNSGYRGLFIITNGFLQPPKDDAEGDEDLEPEYKYLKPEYTRPILHVYPNPATNYLTIEIPMQEAGKIRLTLYNSMGELVYEKEITGYGQHTKERISMGAFMQGTYLLRVQMGPPGTRAKELTYKIFKAN